MTIALEALDVIDALPDTPGRVRGWHILTGEYPPDCGGVGDYTRLVAQGLAAAGDRVTVWTPARSEELPRDAGVAVERLPDHFGLRSLRALSRVLDGRCGDRVLVQYVPHAFGWKGANVPFCVWLRTMRRHGIIVMFHEVAFPRRARAPLGHNALALVTRGMAGLVAKATAHAFVSIPGWQHDVEAMSAAGTPVEWLPVPSTIAVVDDPAGSAQARRRYAAGRPLVGHFGTYGRQIRSMLHACLPAIAAECHCAILLLGQGSDAMARGLCERHPHLADRVHSAGRLSPGQLSIHVRACDLMLQPYPDGVSTRRTSAMAALAHGCALVTTAGALTESFWRVESAAVMVPADDPAMLATAASRLVDDAERRTTIAQRGRGLYDSRFAIGHTIAALRRIA